MLNGKSILLTGGTGSFAQSYVKFILNNFKNLKRLVIFSRDEFKQFEMSNKFPPEKYPFIRYYIGDVRDKSRLVRALEDINYVIHSAALKQVPKAELDPVEYIKTNILGAQNLIEASIEQGVEKVIALSTDKAASPINLYGATKLCADKLFISANNIIGPKKMSFSIVRYGNVAGSRGSIIPYFKTLSSKNTFPITDRRMTRFWITLDKCVDMVNWVIRNGRGGEIFVPKIPSFKIIDLAQAINPKAKHKIIGILPGEKINEELITKSDSLSTYDFGKYYCILPGPEKNRLKKYKHIKVIKKIKSDFSYGSGDNPHFLTVPELRNLIKDIY